MEENDLPELLKCSEGELWRAAEKRRGDDAAMAAIHIRHTMQLAENAKAEEKLADRIYWLNVVLVGATVILAGIEIYKLIQT